MKYKILQRIIKKGNLEQLFVWLENKRTFKKVIFLPWRDPASYFRAEFFPNSESVYPFPITNAIARKAKRKIATK